MNVDDPSVPTDTPSTRPPAADDAAVYRIAIFGRRNAGKTCLLASLMNSFTARVASAVGQSEQCSIVYRSPGDAGLDEGPHAVDFLRGEERLTAALKRLEDGELPAATSESEQMMRARFRLACGGRSWTFDLCDYAGEFVDDERAAGREVDALRELFEESDAAFVICPAVPPSGGSPDDAKQLQTDREQSRRLGLSLGRFEESLKAAGGVASDAARPDAEPGADAARTPVADAAPLRKPFAFLLTKADRMGPPAAAGQTGSSSDLPSEAGPEAEEAWAHVRSIAGSSHAGWYPVQAVPAARDAASTSKDAGAGHDLLAPFLKTLDQIDEAALVHADALATSLPWQSRPPERKARRLVEDVLSRRPHADVEGDPIRERAESLRGRLSAHRRKRYGGIAGVAALLLVSLVSLGVWKANVDLRRTWDNHLAALTSPTAETTPHVRFFEDFAKDGGPWYFAETSGDNPRNAAAANDVLAAFDQSRVEADWASVEAIGNPETRGDRAYEHRTAYPGSPHLAEADGFVDVRDQLQKEREFDARIQSLAEKRAADPAAALGEIARLLSDRSLSKTSHAKLANLVSDSEDALERWRRGVSDKEAEATLTSLIAQLEQVPASRRPELSPLTEMRRDADRRIKEAAAAEAKIQFEQFLNGLSAKLATNPLAAFNEGLEAVDRPGRSASQKAMIFNTLGDGEGLDRWKAEESPKKVVADLATIIDQVSRRPRDSQPALTRVGVVLKAAKRAYDQGLYEEFRKNPTDRMAERYLREAPLGTMRMHAQNRRDWLKSRVGRLKLTPSLEVKFGEAVADAGVDLTFDGKRIYNWRDNASSQDYAAGQTKTLPAAGPVRFYLEDSIDVVIEIWNLDDFIPGDPSEIVAKATETIPVKSLVKSSGYTSRIECDSGKLHTFTIRLDGIAPEPTLPKWRSN